MKRSIEQLYHFLCEKCAKWWTIGDVPLEKVEWFCPWCGVSDKKEPFDNFDKLIASKLRARKKFLKLSAQAKKLKLGIYKHYKGGRYEVIGVAFHSETLEEMVIYREDYGKKMLCVRQLTMFLEKVIHDRKRVERFKYIGK